MNQTKLILIIVISFAGFTARGQWTTLNSGTTLDLKVITQNQSGFLLVAGEGSEYPSGQGIIIKSDNGGATWYNVANNATGFSDIVFTTQSVGLAIPKSLDTIFKTTDAGNTWLQQYSLNCYGPSRGWPEVWFTDSITGYVPGYKTTDGGDSWFLQFPEVQQFPYIPVAISFLNDSTGIIAGFEYWGAIAKTTDRGNTWNWVNVPYSTWEIYSLHFPTVHTGYCTSFNYSTTGGDEIIKTTDSGDNWYSIYTSPSPQLLSIFCTDSNTCYTVGDHGNIAKTTDGGITWSSQYSGTTKRLRKVFFTDANTGYIVGDSGTILKTINGGGATGINSISNPISIVSIFPNPSHTLLTIQINSDNNHSFQFTLSNSLGEKLTDKILENKTSVIDLSPYDNGIYFYKLTSGNNLIKTGKIVKQ